MKLTLERQLELFDKHKKLAGLALGAYLHRHVDEIIALARERLQTIGLEDYGDDSWWQTRDEQKREIREELADGVCRNVFLKAQDAGDLK